MKIGIDARMISWGGVGRYTANLLHAFAKLGGEHTFVLFCLPESAHLVPGAPHFERRIVKQPVFSMPGQLSWAREIADSHLDLFHSPHFPAPLLYRGRLVVTIHDLIPIIIPESMPSKAAQIYFHTMSRLAARRADLLLTVSEVSRNDLVKRLGASPDKIRVIYEAADSHYHPVPAKQAKTLVAQRFGLTDPYLLHVGAQKPHKNVPALIKAYSTLEPAIIEKYPLVLAGAEDKRFPEVRNAVKTHKVRRTVRFLGYVDEETLPALYSAAKAMVYPSLYEGFGFPPLEAMACGTPVIAANSSSLPEVLGDSAVLVDPANTVELAKALMRVLTDEAFRAQLIDKGTQQVSAYSWERAAEETLAAYRAAAG